jgi:hypothetical protein
MQILDFTHCPLEPRSLEGIILNWTELQILEVRYRLGVLGTDVGIILNWTELQILEVRYRLGVLDTDVGIILNWTELQILEVRYRFGVLGIDVGIILNWTVKKYSVSVWTGFICLRRGYSGGPL